MAKRRKKKKSFGAIGYLAIFAVVATIAIVTWVRGITLQAKIADYETREAQLQQMIADEEQRTQEIEEKKVYTQTKQYYEEIAREKCGLVYEDEVVFKASDN